MESESHSPYIHAYRRRLHLKVAKPSKIETIKRSVNTVSREYCAESSICGLKHLVEDTTQCERYYINCESTCPLLGSRLSLTRLDVAQACFKTTSDAFGSSLRLYNLTT